MIGLVLNRNWAGFVLPTWQPCSSIPNTIYAGHFSWAFLIKMQQETTSEYIIIHYAPCPVLGRTQALMSAALTGRPTTYDADTHPTATSGSRSERRGLLLEPPNLQERRSTLMGNRAKEVPHIPAPQKQLAVKSTQDNYGWQMSEDECV